MDKKRKRDQNVLLRFSMDEMKLFEMENDNWWIWHNRGHFKVLRYIKKFIEENQYDKKMLLKELKKFKRESKLITNRLDKKYNDFQHGEAMSVRDEIRYSYYDGIDCECCSLREMIMGKKYYDKNSYIPFDWSGWLDNGKEVKNK